MLVAAQRSVFIAAHKFNAHKLFILGLLREEAVSNPLLASDISVSLLGGSLKPPDVCSC